MIILIAYLIGAIGLISYCYYTQDDIEEYGGLYFMLGMFWPIALMGAGMYFIFHIIPLNIAKGLKYIQWLLRGKKSKFGKRLADNYHSTKSKTK